MTATLVHTETIQVVQPLYQAGCKITAGARARGVPPTWQLARALVLARRASSRILHPAAATKIQSVWRIHVSIHRENIRRNNACVKIQAAIRCHQVRTATVALAILMIQSGIRRHLAKMQREKLAARQIPAIIRVQAHWRSSRAAKSYRAKAAAAAVIQAAWRMVRSQVLGGRLARAAARLREGTTLSKLVRGGGRRHDRVFFLSRDLQRLCWAATHTEDDGGSAEEGEGAAKGVRSIAMASVTAVTRGAKTHGMKRVEARAHGGLDELRAVSVLSSDRVLDVVAESPAAAARWLRDLRTILVYGHHLNHAQAVRALEAGVRRGSLADEVPAARP